MSKRPDLRATVEHMLAKFGGVYTFADIIKEIENGRMQSFVLNDSWVVTQVNSYPQRKALEVVFAVGDMPDLETLHSEVIGFGREVGADLMMTIGRNGFRVKAKEHGWT